LEKVVGELLDSLPKDPEQNVPSLAELLRAAAAGDLSPRHVLHEICVLLLSNATPALLAATTFYQLSRHPRVRDKVDQEIIRVLVGRSPDAADLTKLTYLDCVIKEVMRYLPPVGLIPRLVVQDWTCNGLRVPAGSHLHISPYLLHRHPRYWEQPEVFCPERFDETSPQYRPVVRGSFIPFGSGVRRCIGDQLALLEAKLMVILTMQRFRLEVEPSFVPHYDVSPFGANYPEGVCIPVVVHAKANACGADLAPQG
jgi:cytochrome P450